VHPLPCFDAQLEARPARSVPTAFPQLQC
jgi:hypothetical protein